MQFPGTRLHDFVADFHGHRPAVYINQHLLWALMSVASGTLTQTFGSSRIASPAYQEWPTWLLAFNAKTPIKRVPLLTNLKFENRSRSFRPRFL